MNWLKQKWFDFEAWINSWLPGFKTKLIAFLGLVGNGAFAVQAYLQGLNLDPGTMSKVLIANAVLYTLAYWLRGIGDRVDSRIA